MGRIIALSGYARSGKDTFAAFLTEDHGFTRAAFADNVRAAALAVDPVVGAHPRYRLLDRWMPLRLARWVPVAFTRPVRLGEVVEQYGWEEAKSLPEIRRLLQVIGTEAGREIHGPDLWVNALVNSLDPDLDYVITDCRFPNEADAVKALGGQVIRITRPGCGPINGHASETALDDYPFDDEVSNDGSLEDLAREAEITAILQ